MKFEFCKSGNNHSFIIIREALILTLSIFIVLYFLVFTVLATGMIPNDMIYRDHIIQYTPQGVYYCPRDNISRAETMTNGNYNAERMAVHCPVSGCNGKFTPLGPWDFPWMGILHSSALLGNSLGHCISQGIPPLDSVRIQDHQRNNVISPSSKDNLLFMQSTHVCDMLLLTSGISQHSLSLYLKSWPSLTFFYF